MTLNGAMALILRYFTEFGSFSGTLRIKVVECIVVEKFTFAISSPDEIPVLLLMEVQIKNEDIDRNKFTQTAVMQTRDFQLVSIALCRRR